MTTTTIQATEDMFVYTPNNTYQSHYLLTGHSVANNNTRKSFIRYDLTHVVNPEMIARAEILLTTMPANTSNGDNALPQQVGLYQLLAPFNVNTLWNSSPSAKMDGVITCVSHYDMQYSWDITNFVNDWITNPARNFGVCVLVENCANGVESAKSFHSLRSVQHNRTPQLRITMKQAPQTALHGRDKM